MILVTGATGRLGRLVIAALLQHQPASKIVALVRDLDKAADLKAQGVHVRRAHYHHYDDLVAAFAGVDKILLVSAVAFTDRVVQHQNVIRAAVAAGVGHLFYTSIQRDSAFVMTEVTVSDLETESCLKSSGLTYTILRMTYYAEGLRVLLGPQVLQTGVNVPAGTGRVTFATLADLGAATAAALLGEGHENEEYTLTGPKAYSFDDVAQLLSELAGRPIAYTDVPLEAYVAQKIAEGFSAPVANFFAQWAAAMKQGMLATPDPTLERLLNRPATPLRTFLGAAYFNAQQALNPAEPSDKK
ncbi:NmrA family NAD(P)-binding protein [Hymenobacter negativus]|uniref:NmrA family NAD(P)-binding protein n=1 Tax=Hymenobacter negativus TaxID=2795026 RepID=A0ABS3QLH9_9BACT|nr:NmrA family NAD(P)-binding protein [Hymenobacter negativus]MBO2012135.1 NmrA family NAD(P)-binding protein [Hymenobacter negativus]